MKCLLCESPDAASFKVVKKPEYSYFHCAECDLIFMDPAQRLSPPEEKVRYDMHENQDQAGYRAFLEPLVKYIEEHKLVQNHENARALDFGCGPTAFFGHLLTLRGFDVTNYDLFYQPNQDCFTRNYHLISSTEVWEHLHEPRKDIHRLVSHVKPGGILAVMTSGHKGEAAFHDWHYRRDPTHVSFFSEKTMKWVAKTFNLELVTQRSPYWVFKRPSV